MQFSRPEEHDHLAELAARLREKTEDLGLYMQDATVATADPDAAMEAQVMPDSILTAIAEGKNFMLLTTFIIGDLAFSKRVQNPEQDAIDKQVQPMIPTDAELLKEKIQRRIAQGKSIFDEDD